MDASSWVHAGPITHSVKAWLASVALLGGLTAAAFFGPWRDDTYANPQLLFSLVIVSALACIVGATIVIALADRRELAELGLLGSALMAASVMPLVHGLVTPDVLYDDTEAFRTSVFLSLPIAIAAGAPLLTPHSAFGRWAARHWRDWSLLCLLGVFAIGSVVVSYPDTIVTPGPVEPGHDRPVRGAGGGRADALAAAASLLRPRRPTRQPRRLALAGAARQHGAAAVDR